jgi:hypothetical protein
MTETVSDDIPEDADAPWNQPIHPDIPADVAWRPQAEIARLVTEHAGRQKTAKAEGKTASRSRTCAGCDGPAHKCDECGRAWAKYPARDLSGIAGCVCGICIRDDGSLSFA